MLIVKALLKYGYSGFKLEILEYCNKNEVIEREQYYIETLNPEYNTLKVARSSYGFRHSKETLDRLRGRKLLYSTRLLMKDKAIGRHIGLNTLKKL